jgi:hypothetical protein
VTPEQVKCDCCSDVLSDKEWYSAYVAKRKKRCVLCKGCLGELDFGVVPRVTGSRAGVSGPLDVDAGSYQANARRALEDAPADMEEK